MKKPKSKWYLELGNFVDACCMLSLMNYKVFEKSGLKINVSRKSSKKEEDCYFASVEQWTESGRSEFTDFNFLFEKVGLADSLTAMSLFKLELFQKFLLPTLLVSPFGWFLHNEL